MHGTKLTDEIFARQQSDPQMRLLIVGNDLIQDVPDINMLEGVILSDAFHSCQINALDKESIHFDIDIACAVEGARLKDEQWLNELFTYRVIIKFEI